MKHIVVIGIAALVSVGCMDPAVTQGPPVPDFMIPPGLADCGFYRLVNKFGSTLHVVRCPNSTVSTATLGKNPSYSTTIDVGNQPSPDDEEQKTTQREIATVNEQLVRLNKQKADLEGKLK